MVFLEFRLSHNSELFLKLTLESIIYFIERIPSTAEARFSVVVMFKNTLHLDQLAK